RERNEVRALNHFRVFSLIRICTIALSPDAASVEAGRVAPSFFIESRKSFNRAAGISAKSKTPCRSARPFVPEPPTCFAAAMILFRVHSRPVSLLHERDRINSKYDVGKNEHGKSNREPATEDRTALFNGWFHGAKNLARAAHIGMNFTSNRQFSPQVRIRHELF